MFHRLPVAAVSRDGHSACVCMRAFAFSTPVGYQPNTDESLSLCRHAGWARRHLRLCIQDSYLRNVACFRRRSRQLSHPVLHRNTFLFRRSVSLRMCCLSTLVAINAQRQYRRSDSDFDSTLGRGAWQMRSGAYALQRNGTFPGSVLLPVLVSQTVELLPQLFSRLPDSYSCHQRRLALRPGDRRSCRSNPRGRLSAGPFERVDCKDRHLCHPAYASIPDQDQAARQVTEAT